MNALESGSLKRMQKKVSSVIEIPNMVSYNVGYFTGRRIGEVIKATRSSKVIFDAKKHHRR